MVADPASRAQPVDPALAAAVDRWAQRVFGAPRRLSASITAVTIRDEVLHRVLTSVVRRDLREERTFAPEREASSPRIPLSQADPFLGTPETLRADTLHVVACSLCSSLAPCHTCGGKQVVTCPSCEGAGKFRNPKTKRLNKCKACKSSGSIRCEVCSGRPLCSSCHGSGHQRVWLSYAESRTTKLTLHPINSSLVVAHPRLGEQRFLTSRDVETFSVAADACTDGPLPVDGLSPDAKAIAQRELAALDHRTERVVRQQYTCLAVVRRDVTYEMCGSRGTVELSGPMLSGDSTPVTTGPIRRRLVFWALSFVIFSIVGGLLASSAMGKAAYFGPSNRSVSWLLLGATLLSIPWIGGLLRAWRPVLRIRGLRSLEIAAGIAWALMLVAIPVVGAASRPEAREVEEALAAGNVTRARIVLDALLEREGKSASRLEVEDAVLMAEADAVEGAERLAKLDAVASHEGATASAASELARADRLATIRTLVAAGRANEAIDAIERDFADTWGTDAELAEERARAEELRADRCLDDPCRFVARSAARRAHETPARAEAVTDLRTRLLGALVTDRDLAALTPTARIQAGDEIASLAQQVLTSEIDEEAITVAARAAQAWAADQRATVPILGADLDTLRAFFPGIDYSSAKVAHVSLEGAKLFFNLDAKGTCRGVYAVGPSGHRELDGPFWSAEQIVSQAFGRPVKLVPTKAAGDTSSTWKESQTKVVARWRGGVPIELRIGDATP